MIQRSLKYSFQDEQVSERALMVEGGECYKAQFQLIRLRPVI